MKIPTLISLLLLAVSAGGQDIHFSQFSNTPIIRNPALAGIFDGDLRASVIRRDQWKWTLFPYETTALSMEYKFGIGDNDDHLTIGLQTYRDIAGSSRLSTLHVMPALNFHKSLNAERSEYLSLGFTFGALQKRFDLRNLTFDHQYRNGNFDPTAGNGEPSLFPVRTVMDMGVGLSYNNSLVENTGSYYIGASMMHINTPEERFSERVISLGAKLQLNGGLHLPLNRYTDLVSEFNYSNQSKFNEVMINSRIRYHLTETDEEKERSIVSVGLGLRWLDAIFPSAEITYKRFTVGVSYDVNLSTLRSYSRARGGLEISLSVSATRPEASAQQRLCPRF